MVNESTLPFSLLETVMNTRDTGSLALTTFFGILIGLFTAWSLNPLVGSYWPVDLVAGAILGGLFSYLACDCEGAVRAVPRAWSHACQAAKGVIHWQPSAAMKIALKTFPVIFYYCLAYAGWITLAAAVIAPFAPKPQGFSPILFGAGCTFLLTLLICMIECLNIAFMTNASAKARAVRSDVITIGRDLNPATVLLYYLPRAIYKGACWTPTILRQFGQFGQAIVRLLIIFVWQLYVLIHTQLRLICLLDSVIFIGGFYFTHSIPFAFLAATLGAIWGVINYVVIAPRIVPRAEATA